MSARQWGFKSGVFLSYRQWQRGDNGVSWPTLATTSQFGAEIMMASSYNAKDEDGHITVTGPGGGPLRSKKPENTAFKQQRLPAWQPILTAGTVLPAFFIIGLIFIPIGIGLYVTSNNIKEFEVTLYGT